MARVLHYSWLLSLAVAAALAGAQQARAQALLDGEFSGIDLGRQLIDADRIPTIRELRALVADPRMRHVLMLKLYGDENNHSLPVWSADGQRLAFQRTDVSRDVSKLLLFEQLSQPSPTLLTDDENAYDFAFRWAENGRDAYTFARLNARDQAAQILVSVDGQPPAVRTSPGKFFSPALYARTDGIWRLAYENNGRLMHQAWAGDQTVYDPLALSAGTTPRWSQDGFRLLAARGLPGQSSLGTHEVVILNLSSDDEVLVPSAAGESVRSPVWSPDERHAAYYARAAGSRSTWMIRVAEVPGSAPSQVLASDVIVNADFNSQGPSWEPSGRRIWFFSNERRDQAYYPLVCATVGSSSVQAVDYPRRCTTPRDLAVNPASRTPELAFVGHDRLTQDLYVVLLNHY